MLKQQTALTVDLNLGSYTGRGRKKCPNCGFINGQASIKCKNKSCFHVFVKHKLFDKRPSSSCAIELITNMEGTKIYSVRTKEKKVEKRNFVRIDETVLCLVDKCEEDPTTRLNGICIHVKNADETRLKARRYKVSNAIFSGMNISEEIRRSIMESYAVFDDEFVDDVHPLVQRINKNYFVVKCRADSVFPLGLLHVNFSGFEEEPKSICACRSTKNPGTVICEHVVLVIAAILIDDDLKNEFRTHLQSLEWTSIVNVTILNEIEGDLFMAPSEGSGERYEENQFLIDLNSLDTSINGIEEHTTENSFGMDSGGIHLINVPNIPSDCPFSAPIISLDDGDGYCHETLFGALTDCQIELMDQFDIPTDQLDFEMDLLNENHSAPMIDSSVVIEEVQQTAATVVATDRQFESRKPAKRRRESDDQQISLKEMVRILASNGILMQKTRPEAVGNAVSEPTSCSQTFLDWLDSVIERINLTMDYNESGCPEPLVFSVCHDFFQCLQARFLTAGVQRRPPNEIETIKTGPRRGLKKRTWWFYSYNVVRRIFSTKNMHVEQEISFAPSSLGDGFDRLTENLNQNAGIDSNNLNLVRIQPKRHQAVLKVGSPSNHKNKTDSAFVMEWTENVLPKTKYGEMRLIFQFFHKENSKIVVAPNLKVNELSKVKLKNVK